MNSFKKLVKDWLPPVVAQSLVDIIYDDVHYDGPFDSWKAAARRCVGYDAQHILHKVLNATLKVKKNEVLFERDSVVFNEANYSWPIVACMMWAVAAAGGRLDVLDFGGALGSSYYQYKKLLEPLPLVRWSVVEQSHFVEAGRNYIQDGELQFYVTIDECLQVNSPNIILFSSVLQYLENPYDILEELVNYNFKYLLIDKTPFSNCEKIVVQKVPKKIYDATYPMWVIDEEKMLSILYKDWNVIETFCSAERQVRISSFDFKFKGLILERKIDC